jgi:hypothetical protein
MTLDEAHEHIGARVVYHPRRSGAVPEYGEITSVGTMYVFVRYSDQDATANGKGTAPEFLTFAHTHQDQETNR